MTIKEILKCQWQGYAKFHQSRANLLIHIFAVPVFILGVALFLYALYELKVLWLITALLLMVASIGVQGIGHKKEALATEPFTGAMNAVTRILLEQLYTFPKFVILGHWYSAYKNL